MTAFERWTLLLMISFSVHGSPQKGKEATVASRDITLSSPMEDDTQYVLMNGVYTNSRYRMALPNPTMLMRSQLATSYAEVSARTVSRKVDSRKEAVKLRPSIDNSNGSSVVFYDKWTPASPSNKTSTGVSNTSNKTLAGADTAQTRITDRKPYVPSKDDAAKCQRNPLTCNETSFYPEDYIKKLFEDKKINRELLTNDKESEQVLTRFDEDNKKQFCEYTQTIHYPKIGNTIDGNIRFIIQSPELNITQGIRVESCVSKGDTSCGSLKTHLPPHYQLECVQKYAFRHLVAITDTGATREQFEIPSCCVCMYRDKK